MCTVSKKDTVNTTLAAKHHKSTIRALLYVRLKLWMKMKWCGELIEKKLSFEIKGFAHTHSFIDSSHRVVILSRLIFLSSKLKHTHTRTSKKFFTNHQLGGNINVMVWPCEGKRFFSFNLYRTETYSRVQYLLCTYGKYVLARVRVWYVNIYTNTCARVLVRSLQIKMHF